MSYSPVLRLGLAAAFVISGATAALADASANSRDDDIFWIVEVTINDGKDAAFDSLMSDMVASTKTEEGITNYEWMRNGAVVHQYERYDDAAAVLAHLGGFGKFAESYFDVFSLTGFTVYGSVPDNVKEAIAGFKPVYLEKAGGFAR